MASDGPSAILNMGIMAFGDGVGPAGKRHIEATAGTVEIADLEGNVVSEEK